MLAKPRRRIRDDEPRPAPELTLPLETAGFIILKAREFDAKDVVVDERPDSNPADDTEIDVFEDHGDDPTAQELASLIDALSEDEQVDLVGLAWLGRDDNTAADWPEVRAEAARAHNDRTAAYLLGMPLLGDLIEEGLATLGYAPEDYDADRM